MYKTNFLKPLEEGLWVATEGGYLLLGHLCTSCNEVFFPRRRRQHCPHCFCNRLKEIYLGPDGRLSSFSIVMIAPGGGFYRGPVPYAYGCIDLPDEVRIRSLLASDEIEILEVGMAVTLTIEVLYVSDDGVPVATFLFRSRRKDQEGKQ